MRWFMALTIAAALVATAIAADHAGDSDRTMTGVYKTDHFDVRYRPGSRAGASVERTGAMAERDLARICAQLEVKNDTRYSLFLFDDLAELSAVTKTGGTGGFSAGDASGPCARPAHRPEGASQLQPRATPWVSKSTQSEP